MRGNTFGHANTNACTYCHPNAYRVSNSDCNAHADGSAYTNSHPNPKSYTDARKWFSPDAQSNSRIELYFFKRDLYLERW